MRIDLDATDSPRARAITTVEVPDTQGNTALRMACNDGRLVRVETVKVPRGRTRGLISVSVLREAVSVLGDDGNGSA